MSLPNYIRIGPNMVRTSSIFSINKSTTGDAYCVNLFDVDMSEKYNPLSFMHISKEEAEKLMCTLEQYNN